MPRGATRVVQSERQRGVMQAIGVVSLLMLVPLPIAQHWPGALTVWTPVGIAYAAFCWLGCARSGVYVCETGVSILNPIKTHDIAWSEIGELRLRGRPPFRTNAEVVLQDGRTIRIFGIAARPLHVGEEDDESRPLLAELNRELDKHSDQ